MNMLHEKAKVEAGLQTLERKSENLSITGDRQYASWLSELKLRYQRQQIKAAVHVNSAMLEFYWELGHDIVERDWENVYGSGFFRKLSADLRKNLDSQKVFSENNLRYMRSFYRLYLPYIQNLQQPVGESAIMTKDTIPMAALFSIPWGHHVQIINRCGGCLDKALFYVRKCQEFNWSRSVLMNFLETDLYEREGKALTNFKTALPQPQGDLAQEMTRDPYSFNFLTIESEYREKELKAALLDNITRFLLELGNGFAYMGKEFRLDVVGSELFLDLLFYNINLRCYIVIEEVISKLARNGQRMVPRCARNGLSRGVPTAKSVSGCRWDARLSPFRWEF